MHIVFKSSLDVGVFALEYVEVGARAAKEIGDVIADTRIIGSVILISKSCLRFCKELAKLFLLF
jgi:hypothetical protein